MRAEQEMMALILRVAEADDRVRAVAMNGSRTNPHVPRDIFQDYDVVYLVTEMAPFLRDPAWVDVFGERIMLQTPEAMAMFPPELGGRFSYLMLFTDGNRIDLTLVPIQEAHAYAGEDSLTRVLLDKDQCLPPLPPPTDTNYRVQPPSAAFFADCCNEFWWLSTYVAKGLWRKEILYAKKHLDQHLSEMLVTMLAWQVGIDTDFSVSVGKCGKYLQRYLAPACWQALLATYADASYDGTWSALWAACDLFRQTAQSVAAHFGYTYAQQDDDRVTAYLHHVHALAQDAS